MEQNENLKDIFGSLDKLLGETDLKDVTAESAGFAELPEGYYLSEVEKAELKVSKSSHQPMVAFQMKIVEDGKGVDENGDLFNIKGSKNRKIFMYYTLKNDSSVKRFVTDMLKFEGEEPGKSILEKECFTTSELLEDALEILIGMRIFVQVSVTENDDGSKSTWQNLISWKRAANLELCE